MYWNRKEIQNIKDKLQEKTKEFDILDENYYEIEKDLIDTNDELLQERDKNEKLSQDVDIYKDMIPLVNKLNDENKELNDQNKELKNKLKIVTQQNQDLKEELRRIQQENDRMKKNLKKIKNLVEDD